MRALVYYQAMDDDDALELINMMEDRVTKRIESHMEQKKEKAMEKNIPLPQPFNTSSLCLQPFIDLPNSPHTLLTSTTTHIPITTSPSSERYHTEPSHELITKKAYPQLSFFKLSSNFNSLFLPLEFSVLKFHLFVHQQVFLF